MSLNIRIVPLYKAEKKSFSIQQCAIHSVAFIITKLLRGSDALSSRDEREQPVSCLYPSRSAPLVGARTRRAFSCSSDTFVVSSQGTLRAFFLPPSRSFSLFLPHVLHYRTLNGRFPRQWAPSATSFEIPFVPSGHNDSPASRGLGGAKETRPFASGCNLRVLLATEIGRRTPAAP